MDSQTGSDLRQALLTSSLGALLHGAGSPDNSSSGGAQDALNHMGSKPAPTPHDLLAIAQAQSFPPALDDDPLVLTLLPNALSSDDEDDEGLPEDAPDDLLAAEFLDARAMGEHAGAASQFSVFADACVVDDPEEGPRLVARGEAERVDEGRRGQQDEAMRAYESRLDGERQGREIARIIKAKEAAAAVEHEGMLARHRIAVVTPQERFAAYKAAMARPADDPAAAAAAAVPAKRQKVHHHEETVPSVAVQPRGAAARYAVPPESGEYVAARTSAGRTLFFPLREPPCASPPPDASCGGGTMGRMSMAQANRTVSAIEEELAMRASLADTAQHALCKLSLYPRDTRLWAEKYRAQTYVDLVSSERTNRAVMEWLNAWDACVFRRGGGGSGGGKDKWRRPERRILLLSGPPGLGKTTLAHVAARQKGYDVVEINASDERTAAKVRDRVLGVTQTQGFGGRARPQLLVIDEIDGASGATSAQGDFITMLVRLATTTAEESGAQASSKDKKKKTKQPLQLLRPIICICNNVYAPVLRPLRQIAQCYHVQGPTASRLAQRLQDVCAREQMPCDPWVLADLARSTECDVRACLNALQLMANNSNNGGTQGAVAGGKDVQRSLFALWAMLFTRADAPGQPRRMSAAEYMRELQSAVRVSGEHERLLQGCWENYLLMDFRDLTHTRVSDLCTQWLCFADAMDAATRRSPQAQAVLQAYQEYPLLAVHLTCSSPLGLRRGSFVYPSMDYAAHQGRGARVAVAQAMLAGCGHARMRFSLTPAAVCAEFADLFLDILSPPLVTANRHLLRGREEQQAARLVDVMVAWGLRMVQVKDAQGQFAYRVEPPVDRLAGFAGRGGAKKVMPMRYAVRQMLAQEIERRGARSAERREQGGGAADRAKEDEKRAYLGRLFADPVAACGAGAAAAVATETPADAVVVTKDFFGRPVVRKVKPLASSSQAPAPDAQTRQQQQQQQQPKAWFHFFEGFSNAVRKPTRMSELL